MNLWNNGLSEFSVTSNKQSNMALDHPNTCLLSKDEIVGAIARQMKYDEDEKRHKLEQTRRKKTDAKQRKKEELEKENQSEIIRIRLANNKFVGDEVNIWVLKPLQKS